MIFFKKKKLFFVFKCTPKFFYSEIDWILSLFESRLFGLVLLNWINSDDLVTEKEKNKILQEEMEATLHDIQNM